MTKKIIGETTFCHEPDFSGTVVLVGNQNAFPIPIADLLEFAEGANKILALEAELTEESQGMPEILDVDLLDNIIKVYQDETETVMIRETQDGKPEQVRITNQTYEAFLKQYQFDSQSLATKILENFFDVVL